MSTVGDMDVLLAVLAVWVLGNVLGAGVWLLLRRSAVRPALPADPPSTTLPTDVLADVPTPRAAVADDVAARITSPA